ncbi:YggS family pyridoxal phosphate-dependent enzyme [Bacillus aerolatus]|uniref:Pyridoxal phosphate homeostasis protein n=1 Tax=Bacillus aerolatus TaxID=2653354 RepID=A0A6I1FI35_9BACI|nr:YggS family pyridoxal phosphate-dependent enzyme [Bacillus aerolatus]KAB7707982.1 YggS family pyridoxal phosphate-dependent enzyme [Bacillus aerolatus]
MKVANKLQDVQLRIQAACKKAGRQPNEVTVIAVTKYVSTERAQEALEAGITHLGENRDEGLSEKWDKLKGEPVWHFIGSLQTRKVKNIIDKASYIHSLDRLSLAKEINKRTKQPINCFIQVNVSGEESKHGLSPEEVIPFVKQLAEFEQIVVCGLMTMAPLTDDEKVLRSCFKKLKQLQVEVQQMKLPHAPCNELSMGMSNDYQLAIEEGATMIRIGTALVGE